MGQRKSLRDGFSDKGLIGKKKGWKMRVRQSESRQQPYRVDETLLDPVEGGPQSAADQAQAR